MDSIAVSLAPSDSTEVRRYGVLGGTHDDVLQLAKKWQAAHPGTALRFAYEAGPTGFPLQRFLRVPGHVQAWHRACDSRTAELPNCDDKRMGASE